MKAYGYLRVSGKGQVNRDGFDRQKEVIAGYASKHDIEIAGFFQEEGISGTKNEDDRPAFQEMLQAILANGVRTVIVERLDRLAREYRIQETLLIYMASKGITLISADTEEDVTQAILADPMKKALIQIQGVFAELEKNLLVKKLRKARERQRATGRKVEGRKSLEETVDGLAIIAKVKALYRKPKAGKRRTAKQIAEILIQEGFKTQAGNEWTSGNVQNVISRYVKS